MTEPDSPADWTDERRRAFREALRVRRERQVRAGQAIGLTLPPAWDLLDDNDLR